MCEINPKHSAFFSLEVFTADPNMTREQFLEIVAERLLAVESLLNEPGDIRVHIHDAKPQKRR